MFEENSSEEDANLALIIVIKVAGIGSELGKMLIRFFLRIWR